MGTKKVDIANIDITGVSVGANAVYVAANARFEWVLGAYSAGGGGSASTQAQGSVSGYTSGGGTPARVDTVDKFPFSSDTDATDVGELTQPRGVIGGGQSSSTHGYTSGGMLDSTPQTVNTIDKFPFSSDTNASDVGDLAVGVRQNAGVSSASDGYTLGGTRPLGARSFIQKFPFTSDTNATSVANLTAARNNFAGQSSTTHGYASGGVGPPVYDTIDKFTFASDSDATDVGEMPSPVYGTAGQNSSTHGYNSSGSRPGYSNVIDKFPFSSDSPAVDVGDVTQARRQAAGQSSTTDGYTSGGYYSPPPYIANKDTIDKFPFASDTDATDVGNLSQARSNSAGQQV